MGIGAVIGGALQGYGAGVAKQGAIDAQGAQADARMRFEQALEATRAQNRRAEMDQQYDLMDRNDARKTARSTDSDIVKLGVKADIDADTDKRKFSQQIKLKSIDLANDKEKLKLSAALDQASAQFKREIASGDMAEFKVGDDGQYYGITREGETKALGVYAQPKEKPDSFGGLGLQPPQTSESQSAPKSKASLPRRTPSAQAGGKTYTTQEAQQTAKARGIPVEAVHRAMRDAGYKLTAG